MDSATTFIVFNINTVAALMNVHDSLLLPSEFKTVQLFQLAVAARLVTMATTETTARETIGADYTVSEFPVLYTPSPAENNQINEEKPSVSNISFKV